MTLSQVDLVIGTVQDLVTLAMAHPCGVRSLNLLAPSEGGDLNFEIYNQWIYSAEKTNIKNLDYNYAFSLAETSFESVVPAWFQLYEKVRVPVRMILGTLYVREGYAGTRLMTICAALEALHRVLFDYKSLSDEDFAGIKSQLKAIDKKYRRKVQIYNSPSYAERIRDLATKADTEAVISLIVDVDRWVSAIRDARVNLAHALASESGDSSGSEKPFRLMRVSRALTLLVLMQAAGLSAEAQRRFVSQHNETSWDASRWRSLLGWGL